MQYVALSSHQLQQPSGLPKVVLSTLDFLTQIFPKLLALHTQGTHGCLWVRETPQNTILRVLGATMRFWGC